MQLITHTQIPPTWELSKKKNYNRAKKGKYTSFKKCER